MSTVKQTKVEVAGAAYANLVRVAASGCREKIDKAANAWEAARWSLETPSERWQHQSDLPFIKQRVREGK